MMNPRFLCIGWIWVVASTCGLAAERDYDVTIDDYFTLAEIAEIAISPDGDQVAYCERRWQERTDDRKSDVWVVSVASSARPRRLTMDGANHRSLKWSADGTAIYCLADRRREAEKVPPFDGKSQVWRLGLEGGEAQRVTEVEGGVTAYDLAPQARRIFFAVDVTVTDKDDFTPLREQFGSLEYHRGKRKVSEIWQLDLDTWRAAKLVAEKRFVRSFAVTADARRLAMITALDDSVLKSEGESRADVWEGGRVTTPPTDIYRAKAASPHAWLESLAWSTDGEQFAFCAIFDAYPTEIILSNKAGDAWRTERMPRPEEVHVLGYGSPLRWHPNGQVFFIAERQAVSVVTSNQPEALRALAQAALPDQSVSAFDIDPRGQRGVYVLGRSQELPDVFVADLKPGAAFRRLTQVNAHTERWRMPEVRHVTWKAGDGTVVGGILELPPGSPIARRHPLLVGIHGGPTTSVRRALQFDPYLGRWWLPAHGYAVLCPNYRGSTGYGDTFLTQLIGRENELDVQDIVAGVEHLVREGVADPEAIGVLGWSNGGYLSNCLISQPQMPFRLRAASSGAGILDTAMEWGINDEPAYPIVLKTGLPWERADVYRRTSPLFNLSQVTAPTLIHVGANDERCPPEHSRMLFRGLSEYLRVPTELVVYTGESHGLAKYSSRKAKMQWDLAWFDKYVKRGK